MGHPHPVTNKLDPHNCWFVSNLRPLNSLNCANFREADVQKEYIAWIIGKGYAVIDVNIPKHITREKVSSTIIAS